VYYPITATFSIHRRKSKRNPEKNLRTYYPVLFSEMSLDSITITIILMGFGFGYQIWQGQGHCENENSHLIKKTLLAP
jgi:hypothetical protein